MLELDEILAIFNEGKTLTMDEEAAETCNYFSQEAQKITCRLNYEYHDPDEIREMFSELIGKGVSDDFRVFPPFTTDFGKNIHLGKNVFINSDCKFQDQGGIYIDGVNVKDISFDDLHKSTAIVSQETYLFNATMRENLRYARPDATEEEIVRAAVKINRGEQPE